MGMLNIQGFLCNKISGNCKQGHLKTKIGSYKQFLFLFQVTTQSQQQQQQQQSLTGSGKRINSTASTRKYSSYPVEEKREAKVTYLTEFELNNQPNIRSAELHNGNNHVKNTDILLQNSEQERNRQQQQSHSSSNATSNAATPRHHMQRSEDELSAVSTSKKLTFSQNISADFSVYYIQLNKKIYFKQTRKISM